jgi:DNA (cytosine-5)-methyltransferase 1
MIMNEAIEQEAFTVGSLFSGIGGIDLGLERAGFKVKWQSEIEPYSCRVLKKHWADIPNLGDITQIKWNEVEPVDVIAGGYPCQPFSLAGTRKGNDDERYLWDYFCEAISVLRPRVAFLENVRGHYTLGFDRVLGDLASIGYDAEWQTVSAQSVGAPHKRERLICLAYPISESVGASADSFDKDGEASGQEWGREFFPITRRRCTTQRPFEWWRVEPCVDRMVDGVPDRLDRLRGLGNAVVPQVAEYVGSIIRSILNG